MKLVTFYIDGKRKWSRFENLEGEDQDHAQRLAIKWAQAFVKDTMIGVSVGDSMATVVHKHIMGEWTPVLVEAA